MDVEMERALTFAILMQRIESKSPDYIMEKWRVVHQHNAPVFLLDPINVAQFIDWANSWGVKYNNGHCF